MVNILISNDPKKRPADKRKAIIKVMREIKKSSVEFVALKRKLNKFKSDLKKSKRSKNVKTIEIKSNMVAIFTNRLRDKKVEILELKRVVSRIRRL